MIDEIYNSDWFKITVIFTTVAAAFTVFRLFAVWLWRKHLQFVAASISKNAAIQSAKSTAKQYRLVKSIQADSAKLAVHLHKDLINKFSSTFMLLGLAGFSTFHFLSNDIDAVRGIGYLAIVVSLFLIFIWRADNQVLFGVENSDEYETQTIGTLTRLTSLICNHDIGQSEGMISDLLDLSKDVDEVLK